MPEPDEPDGPGARCRREHKYRTEAPRSAAGEHCDAPLFFAEPAGGEPAAAVEEPEAPVGRRPGFDGRRGVLGERCHVCREPNKADATYCRRCGAELHPWRPPPLPPTDATSEDLPRPVASDIPLGPTATRDSLAWVLVQVALLFLLVIAAVGVLLSRTLS